MVFTGLCQAAFTVVLQAEPKIFVYLNKVKETTSRRNVCETSMEVRFEQKRTTKSSVSEK